MCFAHTIHLCCRCLDFPSYSAPSIHSVHGTRHNTTLANPNHPWTSTIHRTGTQSPKGVGQSLIHGTAFAASSLRAWIVLRHHSAATGKAVFRFRQSTDVPETHSRTVLILCEVHRCSKIGNNIFCCWKVRINDTAVLILYNTHTHTHTHK